MDSKFKKDMKIFNCFNTFDLEDNKEDRQTFHETIEENNEILLNTYAQEAHFREIMPNIKKLSRSNYFYNKMVKKGFKHKSPFFQILLKAIKEVNEAKHPIITPKRIKRFNIYKLPEIELLKLKKEKIEKINQKKLENLQIKKAKFDKYREIIKEQLSSSRFQKTNSLTPKTIISPLSTFNSNNTNIFVNKNYNSSEKNTLTNNKNLSTYYKSDIKFNTMRRSNSYNVLISPRAFKEGMNRIYDKCTEEIEHGNKVAGNVFKYNIKLTKSIEKKYIRKNKRLDRLKSMIDDKGKKKNKYKKLEEYNMKEIKRKMNEKISYFYAYKNRKEFKEVLRNSESTHAYNIYLDEMNRINERMDRRRIVERKRIDKIESMCEDGFKKKEYLKKIIDKFNKRHKDNVKEKSLIPNDDFYIVNRNNDKDQMGTLLPKLLSLRKTCLEEITVGNFLNKKK
jgi:hypothetical protein